MNWLHCVLVAASTLASTAAIACDQTEVAATTTPTAAQSGEPLRQALAIANAAKRSGPPDAIIIGDSLVARWPLDALRASFGTPKVFKMGVEGDKTQNLLWRLENVTNKTWKPRAVAILVGTNNLSAEDSACSISIALEKIVSRVDTIWKNPHLFLFSLLPRGEGWSFRQQDREIINKSLSEIARSRPNTSLLSYDENIACRSSWPCQNYEPDRLHLTADGYNVMSLYLSDAIRNN